MEDLLDVVDDAVNRGLADRRRLGVTGGSYGGYMTNKLIGRTIILPPRLRSDVWLIRPHLTAPEIWDLFPRRKSRPVLKCWTI